MQSKEQEIVLDDSVFAKLSPLQRRILSELAFGPLTLLELGAKTGSSVHTVGKQLSMLQLRTSYNPLVNRGISKPLVRKRKEVGIKTTYSVCIG